MSDFLDEIKDLVGTSSQKESSKKKKNKADAEGDLWKIKNKHGAEVFVRSAAITPEQIMDLYNKEKETNTDLSFDAWAEKIKLPKVNKESVVAIMEKKSKEMRHPFTSITFVDEVSPIWVATEGETAYKDEQGNPKVIETNIMSLHYQMVGGLNPLDITGIYKNPPSPKKKEPGTVESSLNKSAEEEDRRSEPLKPITEVRDAEPSGKGVSAAEIIAQAEEIGAWNEFNPAKIRLLTRVLPPNTTYQFSEDLGRDESTIYIYGLKDPDIELIQAITHADECTKERSGVVRVWWD